MGSLTVTAIVPSVRADDAIGRVSRFAEYPGHSDAVLSVDVIEESGEQTISDWEVQFRRGILRWREQADHHLERGRIDFSEVHGDIDRFTGAWTVTEGPAGGAEVEFSVDFDIGIPTLDHILDPIAEDALLENLRSILLGLFGADVTMIGAKGSTRTWTF